MFDSYVLAAVVGELQQQIIGARINKLQQPDAHTVVLRCHSAEGRDSLLLSAHPQNGRIHLSSSSRENPAKAPVFIMVLRKWLDGGRIVGVSATPGERVAQLEIETHNEMGDSVLLRLIIEIMGKHSNIILVNENGIIIDGIHRYNSTVSRYREVLPGRVYLAPPPQNKLPLPPADCETLAAALYEKASGTQPTSLQRALTEQINGLSPLLAEHICLAAGIDPQQSSDMLGLGDLEALMQQMSQLVQRQSRGAYHPVLLRSAHGSEDEFRDFYAFPPAQWDSTALIDCVSMNEAVDTLYAAREERQIFNAHRSRIAKQLRAHINRLSKKIAIQERDLAQSVAADGFKQDGDLLAANLWQLEQTCGGRRPEAVDLPSFEDESLIRHIKLDPALSIQENITRLYRRYSKAKHARSLIEQQLDANRQELDYVESIEQALNDSSIRSELTEIEKEGIASGFLPDTAAAARSRGKKAGRNGKNPPKGKTAGGKDKNSTALPPRRFISCDGFTVLIGRNNRQNDRLSLHTAHPDDIWLHTQKIPGSHTVIVSEGRPVPESTLHQAAEWAAWFSKARDSAQVPVDWLPAGQLRKPNGARPGFVVYTGQKTVYVAPQEPSAPPDEV